MFHLGGNPSSVFASLNNRLGVGLIHFMPFSRREMGRKCNNQIVDIGSPKTVRHEHDVKHTRLYLETGELVCMHMSSNRPGLSRLEVIVILANGRLKAKFSTTTSLKEVRFPQET